MRDIAGTATLLASIAVVIVLMLMAPKSFGFESSHPIVNGDLPTQ
ncbi:MULTISPECIES: hypothetical protein [unclassified Mesorhizobium]|nr:MULTISPECIES: hypothetical protein [unclassified Mesorhizobium]